METGGTEESQQAFVTILFLAGVLRLIESVGIDKERPALDIFNRLAHELQFWPKTNRRIRFHLKKRTMLLIVIDNRGIMAGITEVESA